MVSRVQSFAFNGIDVINVDVQVHLSSGMPAFNIVGLGDKAVAESKERIRAAIGAIGLALPPQRLIVNLAPADILKEGSMYDLPIALGLLAEMNVIARDALDSYVVLGELSLDGALASVRGVLPAAVGAVSQKMGIICPHSNGPEAAWAGDIDILAPKNLVELINHFKGTQLLSSPQKLQLNEYTNYPDMSDVKGQESARRALEIAAAGGHNMLMVGPPGAGKSMLASRLPSLIPQLTAKEMLEVSMINSIAGNLPEGSLMTHRGFRAPHHNCSMAAMIGGGAKAKPGEITLAHEGILFLDELPEFPVQVLDSLRQPLETQDVSISRVQAHVTYPANFQLVAAMNPCRCGYLDDASRACSKAPKCGTDYQSKLSGPLLDRIDIHIEVPAIRPSDVYNTSPSENSENIRKRVSHVRQIQQQRYADAKYNVNARADSDILRRVAEPDQAGKDLLERSIDQLGLTMRGHNRVLRVARTIADLEGVKLVTHHHIAEALSYRTINYKQNHLMASA